MENITPRAGKWYRRAVLKTYASKDLRNAL